MALTALGLSFEVGLRTRAAILGIGAQHCAFVINHTPIEPQPVGSVAGSTWIFERPLSMATWPGSGPNWGRQTTWLPMVWLLLFSLGLSALAKGFLRTECRGLSRLNHRRRVWLRARRLLLACALGTIVLTCLTPFGFYAQSEMSMGAANAGVFLHSVDAWQAFGFVYGQRMDSPGTLFPWSWADGVWKSISGILPVWMSDVDLRVPTWAVPLCMLVLYVIARRLTPPVSDTHCQACGYDLSGLSAGMCPECGTATQAGASAEPPRSGGGAEARPENHDSRLPRPGQMRSR